MIGILDWELSTLGNQMCDVAYCSMVLGLSNQAQRFGLKLDTVTTFKTMGMSLIATFLFAALYHGPWG